MNNLSANVLTLTIWPPFFEQVRSGEKTVEGRPFNARYANLTKGDHIQIVDKGCCDNCVVEITRLTRYSSFQEMLEKEGVTKCLPGVGSLEEGVRIYHRFPNYEAQERQYGVIAIAIKVQQTSSCIALSHTNSEKHNFTTRNVTVTPELHSNVVLGGGGCEAGRQREETRKVFVVKKVAQGQLKTNICLVKKTNVEADQGAKRKSPATANDGEHTHRGVTDSDSSKNNRTQYVARRVLLPDANRPPKMMEATLKKIYVDMIKRDTKTIEGRINSGMFRDLRVGQLARFFYTGRESGEVTCKITKLNTYNSFEEMLTEEGYKPCLPDAPSLQAAITTYDRIPTFTKRAERFGVVAIHLKKISDN